MNEKPRQTNGGFEAQVAELVTSPGIDELELPALRDGVMELAEKTTDQGLTAEAIAKDLHDMLDGTFKHMEIAEDEIAQAMEEDPANADLYNGSFKLLVPTGTLISDELYRRHCQEMLYRVVEGLDTRPGTDAEVLGALSEMSHAAPMNTSGVLAYARMFRRCFPDLEEEANQLEAAAGRERYPGSVDEAIETVRKKLAVKERVLEES